MKNYQSPLKNIYIFLPFFHCIACIGCVLLSAGLQLQEMLSPLSTHACDNVVHTHIICSEFRQSFFFCLQQRGHKEMIIFFSQYLRFVDTFPHVRKHIISFNQFNRFVVNEAVKKLPDHKRPSLCLGFKCKLLLFLFNERCLSSYRLVRYILPQCLL